ncbi:HMA2 domain-containing protein [Roseiflexus sp.]
MLPAGYIAHRIGDRVRVRIPERKGDVAYFMRVERDLAACERVMYVEANPLTASILLRYTGANDDLRRDAINLGLFAIEEMPSSVNPVLTATSERIDQLDRFLQRSSNGSFDLLEVAFVGLIGASIIQVLRGQALGPATTLLAHALTILALYRSRRIGR